MTDKSVGNKGSKIKSFWGLLPFLGFSFITLTAQYVFEFESYSILIFTLFVIVFYLEMKNNDLKLEIGYLSDRVDYLEEDLQNQINMNYEDLNELQNQVRGTE